jgi:hypothetical protein
LPKKTAPDEVKGSKDSGKYKKGVMQPQQSLEKYTLFLIPAVTPHGVNRLVRVLTICFRNSNLIAKDTVVT